MSPTSYQTAPPRASMIAKGRRFVKPPLESPAISEVLKARTRRAARGTGFYVLGGRSGHRRYFRARKSRWGGALQVCRHAWKEVNLATPMMSRCRRDGRG